MKEWRINLAYKLILFTIFLITHDFEETYALCDKVLFLSEGGLRLAPSKNELLGAF